MAALTTAKILRNRGTLTGTKVSFVVADGSTVFPGGIVALNAAGFLVPFAGAVGSRIAGIVTDDTDPDGVLGTAAGDVEAGVLVGGAVLERVTVTGVTGQTDVGVDVFQTTDNVDDGDIVAPMGALVDSIITRFHSATIVDLLLLPIWDQGVHT